MSSRREMSNFLFKSECFPDSQFNGTFCSFAYSHRNAFGRNQKLNISLERGQVDSMFRVNYTDPWIEGDDKRTSRSINIQVNS